MKIDTTMDRTSNIVCITMSMLLCLLAVIVVAQPGFLSIDCGGKTSHTDENYITWVTDTNYIDVGQTADTETATYPSYLKTRRFFPKPLNRSCYGLPVVPNATYLLTLRFAIGNYDEFENSFAFTVETLGILVRTNLTIENQGPVYYDRIFISSGRMLYICLIRTRETDDPFINAIELRTLRDGMYGQAMPGTMLNGKLRLDVGGNSTVRYPHDNFDRIWVTDYVNPNYSNVVRYASSQEPISTNTKNLPPNSVMQTAWIMNLDSYGFPLGSGFGFWKTLLVLYFAEIEMLNASESRSFYVEINGEKRSDIITMVSNYSALELTFLTDETDTFRFDLYKANNSTLGPILNAYEFFWILDTERPTYSQDIEALEAVKSTFNIKSWISDPCFMMGWEGIVCTPNNSSWTMRIVEMNLSGRNLKGLVPKDIGQLNAIVNMSLDNNYLIGPLPNLSNLTKLERLHLQNNNFSGSVPEWLSELKNLKELYSGNQYLCMHEGECIKKIQETRNNVMKHKAILGITISGAVLMILSLMAGIVVYWKKVGRKTYLNEESSMVMVTNPMVSRAFTFEEIVAATENFSRKIGQGGFGSVFFGKLPEGKEIAVKVLSSFSKQGVQEFMNKIDLLSRVHHKNLVSLLGYCDKSRKLVLIYDYMSGGSLRDRLYGTGAEVSKLNWTTRINIAY